MVEIKKKYTLQIEIVGDVGENNPIIIEPIPEGRDTVTLKEHRDRALKIANEGYLYKLMDEQFVMYPVHMIKSVTRILIK
jgi:hypothetical protein